MNTFKKIFSKAKDYTGTLIVKGKVFKDVSMKISPESVTLNGYSDDSIPICDISDLVFQNQTLSFYNKEERFKFESEQSQQAYESLKGYVIDKTIFKSHGALYYIYNSGTRKFDLHEHTVDVKIIFDCDFFIKIDDAGQLLHYEQIKTKTQYYLDNNHKSFVWSVFKDSAFHTFCIEFKENLDFLDFCSKYVECCYKSVNEEGNHEYFKNISTVSLQIDENEDAKNENWTDYEPHEPIKNEFNTNKKVNEKLIMGNNQVFVSRGSSLGVFDLTADDLEFRTHVQNVLNEPDKILGYNQDQSLLVLDKNSKDQLQLLDLNRGEVIEKWDVGTEMNDYFNSQKGNNCGTLIGLSDYSLFRIDPRSKEKVVQKNEYKTKNQFSAGISTTKGDVAVASKKGDLRLYNKIDKRAKSLLPGFGDEVIGIDSSSNGSLVLCTCQNYILLYSVGSDYSKSLGKEKETPKRLQLKPQHLSLMNNDVSFTPAKFDCNDSLIVTSTGRYVVKWRVADVLKGNMYNYSLKALYDVIVDENFIVNGDDIVVALPNDVKKMTENDLKKPN